MDSNFFNNLNAEEIRPQDSASQLRILSSDSDLDFMPPDDSAIQSDPAEGATRTTVSIRSSNIESHYFYIDNDEDIANTKDYLCVQVRNQKLKGHTKSRTKTSINGKLEKLVLIATLQNSGSISVKQ